MLFKRRTRNAATMNCFSVPRSSFILPHSGEVQEWLNWQHWKCCVRETVPWVRIPPSPPSLSYQAPDAVQSRGYKPRQAGNGATVAVRGCAAASPEPDQFYLMEPRRLGFGYYGTSHFNTQ